MRRRSLMMALWLAGSSLAAGVPLSEGAVPYESKGITVSLHLVVVSEEHATVTAKGYRPNSEVTFLGSYDNNKRFLKLGKTRANANGVAVDHIILPQSFTPGSTHILKTTGLQVNGHLLTELTTVKLSKLQT